MAPFSFSQKMSNKFIKSLSVDNSSIKKQRANILGAETETSAREEIMQLEKEVRDLERKNLALTDFYPDSELTLKAAKDNFDSKQWAKDMIKTKLALELKQAELKSAKEFYNEWFGDNSQENVVVD